MIRKLTCVLAAIGAPLAAEGLWIPVDEDTIRGLLVDQVYDYEGAWQKFFVSGRTNYNAGRDSWGYWEARGDAYCSQWPPADGWACYKMEQMTQGEHVKIRFIGESGDITEGVQRK